MSERTRHTVDAACLPSSSDNGELQTKERFTVTDFLPTFSAITLFSSNLESSSDFKGTWQWVRALIDSGFLRSDRVMHNRTPGAGGSRVFAHCTVFYLKRYLEGVSTEKKNGGLMFWSCGKLLWNTLGFNPPVPLSITERYDHHNKHSNKMVFNDCTSDVHFFFIVQISFDKRMCLNLFTLMTSIIIYTLLKECTSSI